MRESVIEKHLVKQVKALGGEVRKVQWIGRRGAPDRLVMLPERTKWLDARGRKCITNVPRPSQSIWVELKATGVPPEEHQVREHKRMRAMGQRVVVIDSIEAVDQLLGI